ncbi:uncharacterized protein TNIN_1511 [Trichonephila inaurata madagascariensis]|uniref:Uncharacterized protein n=1 Tax=Trichonephila inaurata madagascariensis TaxID=2747483 RepID=A0A8X6X7Y0_9ARAC|nr:uncharacterized protein TNIN_1511 [Trichonephila inaurata madagascariensis]
MGRVRIYCLHLATGRTIHMRSGRGPTIKRRGPGKEGRPDQTGPYQGRKESRSEKTAGEKNVKTKLFRFKTQLPSPVYLNGEWEVGFSEIIYPHSWLNLNETNNYFLYKIGDGNISSTVKRTIDVGCYKTMFDIVSAAQLALPKNSNRFTINYNRATKRVKINAVQGSSLHLENLGELLGLKRECNHNGDAQAPLLRIVRTKDQDGEAISQYYDGPQYLPLVSHSFQTIQAELRLNSGDFVPFEKVKGGKTIGKEVLMTGNRVASDVLSGENFKETVKTRSRESGKKLAQKAIDRVQSMVGKSQYKRKRKKQKKFISSKSRKDSDDGLKKRTELFKENATVDIIGCIYSDLFHQDRLLLNLVDLKIKLIRSKPEFCLQGSEGFKVVLDHVSLFIRKVRVNP